MPQNPLKILGINPGTRYLGIAYFDGDDLLDWGIKVINGKWSRRKRAKVTDIISRLIEYYRPNVIVIKKLHPSRSSKNLLCLCEEIVQQAKKKRLRLRRYSVEDLKFHFYPGVKSNRRKLAKHLAANYPVLCHELKKEKNSNNLYHLRMFEAVALAVLCLCKLNK
jgi:hypothetical protein